MLRICGLFTADFNMTDFITRGPGGIASPDLETSFGERRPTGLDIRQERSISIMT